MAIPANPAKTMPQIRPTEKERLQASSRSIATIVTISTFVRDDETLFIIRLPILWDSNAYLGSILYSEEREADISEGDNNPVYQSTTESDNDTSKPAKVHGHRTIQRTQHQPQLAPNSQVANNQVSQQQNGVTPRAEGYRTSAIRESRIKDRPVKHDEKDSAVKIKIQLDLEVEVDLYARVKGDVTIGLM
ncbi:hypothetical protein B7463_g10028, partial [Scytalidium lignicola]